VGFPQANSPAFMCVCISERITKSVYHLQLLLKQGLCLGQVDELLHTFCNWIYRMASSGANPY